MKSPGWAFCMSLTASSTGPTSSAASSGSPRISNSTRAACLFGAICPVLPGSSGERTFCTTFTLERPATTSATALLKAGSLARSVELSTRTLSLAGCWKPASRIRSIRPDSPGPGSFGSIVVVPTAPPRAKATKTKAIHPKVAVFQWEALQRPIRAARLRLLCLVRDIVRPPSGRVGVRVVEGVERAVGRDRDLEEIVEAAVLDGDGSGSSMECDPESELHGHDVRWAAKRRHRRQA